MGNCSFDELNKHKRVNSKERPYVCKHCEKDFTASTWCKNNNIHTEENTFVCKHLQNYLVVLVILSGIKDLPLVKNLSNVSTVGKSLPLPVL